MWYLYILTSRQGRHYIGITEDITNRLLKHNKGDVRSTKAYRPWHVLCAESYDDKTTARKREIFLKGTARARKELFARIDNKASSSNG